MKAIQLPSGRWRARGYNKYTGERPSFTADTRKEAERLANAFNYRESKHGGITFKDAAEKYIEKRTAVLSPNTIRDYRNTLDKHLVGILKRKISTITDETVQVVINDLAKEKSPKTVKNIYGFITVVVRSVEPHRRFKVALPMKVKPQLQIPSESDIRTILTTVQGTNMDVPVRLALYCCMRRGEIAALLCHPECVGTDSVTIRFSQIKQNGKWCCKVPKTYSSNRTVPCPPDLIADIPNAQKVDAGYITDHWIKLMKKLGMSYRFHDLRHASASMMLTVMPTVDVEKFGGWQHGSAVLQSIYAHNVDESLKRSAAKWQEHLEGIKKVDTVLPTNSEGLENKG